MVQGRIEIVHGELDMMIARRQVAIESSRMVEVIIGESRYNLTLLIQ